MEMRRKSKNISIDEPEEEYSNDTGDFKNVFMKLTEKSTIPALSLLHQKISGFWKMVWLMIILFGLSMSIYQSVELVKNYLKYPSFLMEVEITNRSLYFPSITFCPLSIVNWKKVHQTNHSLLHSFNEKTQHQKGGFHSWMLTEVYHMSKEERKKILMTVNDWMTHCFFFSQNEFLHDCLGERSMKALSYSPFYGTCITINPGFKEESRVKMDQISTSIVAGIMREEMDFPYLEFESGLLLSIHAPGTAPVISLNKMVKILPGEYIQIGISAKEIKRLQAPFASNCTDESISTYLTQTSPYQSPETPFIYSREECLITCQMEWILKSSDCYFGFTAINDFYENLGKELCLQDNLTPEQRKEVQDYCNKLCPKPCRELLYEWTPKTTVLSNRVHIMKTIEEPVPTLERKDVRNDSYMITFKLDSTTYVYGEETKKYEISDILGSIGGNLGLWIGLSILSAFEIFELLSNLTVYFVCRICKRRS